ncbi:hypothetical protein ADIS_2764 [Lunatimonas lonarensis]|uniref:Uncharacterized protein n=1 Tax=Lunatimonas lonarensis TaxID=1232681 RepID=R7ZRT0_9BACT|nr:hypothetical protein ADIS_2764 [Lunatimonas lonarensis]
MFFIDILYDILSVYITKEQPKPKFTGNERIRQVNVETKKEGKFTDGDSFYTPKQQ